MRLLRSVLVLIVAAGLLSACGGGGGGSKESFCSFIKKVDQDKSIQDADFSTKDGIKAITEVYAQLVSKAPGEIKDDVKLLSDATKKFAEGDISAATDEEAGKKLQAATKNLESYVEDECKYKLSS